MPWRLEISEAISDVEAFGVIFFRYFRPLTKLTGEFWLNEARWEPAYTQRKDDLGTSMHGDN